MDDKREQAKWPGRGTNPYAGGSLMDAAPEDDVPPTAWVEGEHRGVKYAGTLLPLGKDGKVHPMKKTYMRRFILKFTNERVQPGLHRGVYFTDSGHVGLDYASGVMRFDSFHQIEHTFEDIPDCTIEITWIDAEE